MKEIKWKYEIGQRLIDYNDDGTIKRDLIIIDRKITKVKRKQSKCKNGYTYLQNKYYKYECKICGYKCGEYYSTTDRNNISEYWIEENNLYKGSGCLCCSSKIVVENINSIYKTDPWMIPFIGEEVAKTHAHSSHDKVQVACPDCGRIINKEISLIYYTHFLPCICRDNISYGEKIMYDILKQLKIIPILQLSKTNFKWCKNYRYDFYFELNEEPYICEIHGIQHYKYGFQQFKSNNNIRTLKKEQENDRLKKELALKNGIKEENYIVIDCRKSELEFIKQNILNSRLSELFDLSKVDWLKAEKFTCSNLIKNACELKKNNPELTTTEIGEIMGYCSATIRGWLKKGSILGWCYYDTDDEHSKVRKKMSMGNCKIVAILKNNKILGIFNSVKELSDNSEELFKIKLNGKNISAVCTGRKEYYKGFTFKYI